MIASLIVSSLLMAVAAVPGKEGATLAKNTHDFSRYRIILDRSPFSPPAGSVEAPTPGFATRFSFIGTVRTNDDEPLTAVIQDKEANNRIYFKTEGDTIGAVSIVTIGESPGAKLVLKQGLETATLTLETKASVGAAPPQPTPERPVPGIPAGVRRIPFRRGR
jgi:hypothetical protein